MDFLQGGRGTGKFIKGMGLFGGEELCNSRGHPDSIPTHCLPPPDPTTGFRPKGKKFITKEYPREGTTA